MNRLIFAFIFACALLGCHESGSTLTGGQARHDTGTLTVTYGDVTITDTRESVATTQPSATTRGPGKLNTGTAQEGSIGSLDLSIEQLKGKNTAGSIAVAVLFIALGLGLGILLWLTGKHIAAIVIGVIAFSGACLAFLYPWILGIAFCLMLVGGIVYVIFSVVRMRNQLVVGTSRALSVAAMIDPKLPPRLKEAMMTKQDESTQAAVAQALPRQNASDLVEVTVAEKTSTARATSTGPNANLPSNAEQGAASAT